jgi:DNA-binding SARP family transcriptional activator/predicted ATPase
VSKLVISTLGSPRIEVDGASVHVDTRKAIALLVYLATTERTQSRDHLAGLLWPDYDQERARAALRRTLSALKTALGDRWVTADRLSVSLDLEGVDFDLGALRAAMELPSAHGHGSDEPCPECTGALAAAVERTGGAFLEGFSLRDAEPFEEWQTLEAESAGRDLARALDRLVHVHTAAGDLEAARAAGQRKLALDPLDEPAHRQLMQVYAWKGMRSAALQQYRECVAVLDRELGVSPLPETTALYTAISEGAVEPRVPTDLREPSAPVREPVAHPLRGRSREWESLLGLYGGIDSGLSGRGALAAIHGEAGIGKTRLATELLEGTAQQGAQTVGARGHEGEGGLPHALITQLLEQLVNRVPTSVEPAALAEGSRLVRRLQPEGVAPGPIDAPGAIARFYESIRQLLVASLAGPAPGVVLLDDLHWCDAASLEVLAYVARRLGQTPLLFVLAWRSEEVGQDHPLHRLVIEAAEHAPARVFRLERLGLDDVRALVGESTELPEREIEGLARRLMEETEGLPFFVVEYLNVVTDDGPEWEVPSSVRELLRSRAALVGSSARQVLDAAAVIDRAFDFDTVWRASGRTELEVVDSLEELARHRLVVVTSPGDSPEATYEFSHDKLRGFVYETMSPARRRVLHRRVAEALRSSARGPEGLAGVSALVARHLELGGMRAEAASMHEMAAERARSIFANREALDHYRSALALDHPRPASLHEGVGDMYVLLGSYKKAIDGYQTAAALAEPEAIARIEHKLGEVHQRRGDWELSQNHLVAALETLGRDSGTELRPRILAAMSFNAHRKGELDDAADLARRALEAATELGDAHALAQAHNQLGILENARGRYAEAADRLRESLRLTTELDAAAGRAAALNNLAQTARAEGDLDAALARTREALEICARQGDSHREAALHNNLADLLHERGDTEAAMDELKTATAILADVGDDPAGMLPEVWKLVEW